MWSQVAERDENRDTHTHTHSMISKRSANRMQTERKKKPTFGPSWLQTKRIQIQVQIEESRASWKDSHIYRHHIAPYVISMAMGRESKVHKHCANWTQQTYQHPSYHHDNDHHYHHHHWYYHTSIKKMCCILWGDTLIWHISDVVAWIRLCCLEGVRERWRLCNVTFTGFRCCSLTVNSGYTNEKRLSRHHCCHWTCQSFGTPCPGDC